MSHFVTLVNFYMPELEENCEENMRYAEQIAEVKEKLKTAIEESQKLDPTRPTTMANVFMLEITSPILEIPDVNSYNL